MPAVATRKATKIFPVSIVLDRVEGPTSQCGKVEVRPDPEGRESIWSLANRVLNKWTWDAPQPGWGCDKVDVTITFADGKQECFQYNELRYGQLQNLGMSVRNGWKFHAGKRCPLDWDEARYRLALASFQTEEQLTWFEHLLDTYDTGEGQR